jgi:glutamate racemase
MKIGIFDSGLGGLFILKSLVKKLPQYDYIYLGDTARLPYGNRRRQTIYRFLAEAVDFLFKKDCKLIIVACNTASSEALRKIQQQYLPKHYPDRRVLGVIIPTVEDALKNSKIKKIGILATKATVRSGAYIREIKKIKPSVKVFQKAAPMLVPLIESSQFEKSEGFLKKYLALLKAKRLQAIILGCTHYPILKDQIKKLSKLKIISQDEIIPEKLRAYLAKHPQINSKLSKNKRRSFLVTAITKSMQDLSTKWFGKKISLQKVKLKKIAL